MQSFPFYTVLHACGKRARQRPVKKSMKSLLTRLVLYIDAGSGVLLWQILLSVSAGLFFRILRGFAHRPVLSPVDPQNPLPRICDGLATYVGKASGTNSAAVFKCPTDNLKMFEREGSSYEWNTELNGRRIDETRSSNVRIVRVAVVNGEVVENTDEQKVLSFPPETTPLLLDYENFHPRAPKSGKNVVFMDDHVTPLEVSLE